ncbi:hypothetical protein M406DRAFT_343424 [Cryphonectria parasitica EP155]|uniref:Uncharacterized protein n=1 Tax=Cryphonectria parasitica (strain ATCC 38755 / EP155) TaxID=660469 RepID=A0A9P4XTB6_CRYP1|nr:uncharacterized protein M406DRAFT_343424 [Cryphonectria parasitica EP155]KAF3760305.1 hypothetical protein M406DRAFT_343424 [Cryphonectria parasitica EP155]
MFRAAHLVCVCVCVSEGKAPHQLNFSFSMQPTLRQERRMPILLTILLLHERCRE